MEMEVFYRSVLEQDKAPVVLCDLDSIIIYMNPAAVQHYAKQGGKTLLGQNLMLCHSEETRKVIRTVLDWFFESTDHNMVYEFRNEAENKDVYMVALRDEAGKLIGYYEKHEFRTHETRKRYDFHV